MLFGRPTLSRPVSALLARADVPSALYQPVPVAWYEPGRRTELPLDNLGDLADFAGRGSAAWLDAWLLAGAAAQHAVDLALAGIRGRPPGPPSAPWSGPTRADSWYSAPPTASATWTSPERPPRSRAPSSSPTGASPASTGRWPQPLALPSAGRQETTVLLGDVTFLHDAGGLLLGAGEEEPNLRIVVLNDAGGAIFGLLEHGAVEAAGRYGTAVERLFGTPHSVDLAALAAAYGVAHRSVSTTAELAGRWRSRGRAAASSRCGRSGTGCGSCTYASGPPWARPWPESSRRSRDGGGFRCGFRQGRLAQGVPTRNEPVDALSAWRGAKYSARPYTRRVRALPQRTTGTVSLKGTATRHGNRVGLSTWSR